MNEVLEQNKLLTNFLDLIYPFDLEEFKSSYWEKNPLVVHRDNPLYYESLFSISNVDELLDLYRPKGKSLRIVKNQEPLPAAKYENPDGSLNLNQIYAAYADGYTVVVNEINRFWRPVKNFCQNMNSFLNHRTVANMYLTPKNQKALLPHYDAHDVYVVQVHGKKHWKIYDAGYKTPLVNSFQPVFQREQLQNVKEITLNAGDLMYIPRGVPHEAVTTDEPSLHLTIGVYATQWVDLLMKSLYHLAQNNPELRKSLPIGFLNNKSGEFLQELDSNMKTLLQENMSKAHAQGPLQLLAEDYRMEQPGNGDGHFEHLNNLEDIGADTLVAKRDHMTCTVQPLGMAVRIIYPGNVIKGPAHITQALKFIAEASGTFGVSEIPAMSDENRVLLVKRLVRGGLLKVEKSLF